MRERLEINPADGSMALLPSGTAIAKGLSKADAEAQLGAFARGSREHGNGYAWLSFQGFDLGGMPCWLSLGFHEGLLDMALISVDLPGAPVEDGWPTKKAIDKEVAFVRQVLREQLGRSFGSGTESFPWGTAWSLFDPKGFTASAGVRYA